MHRALYSVGSHPAGHKVSSCGGRMGGNNQDRGQRRNFANGRIKPALHCVSDRSQIHHSRHRCSLSARHGPKQHESSSAKVPRISRRTSQYTRDGFAGRHCAQRVIADSRSAARLLVSLRRQSRAKVIKSLGVQRQLCHSSGRVSCSFFCSPRKDNAR